MKAALSPLPLPLLQPLLPSVTTDGGRPGSGLGVLLLSEQGWRGTQKGGEGRFPRQVDSRVTELVSDTLEVWPVHSNWADCVSRRDKAVCPLLAWRIPRQHKWWERTLTDKRACSAQSH